MGVIGQPKREIHIPVIQPAERDPVKEPEAPTPRPERVEPVPVPA